MDVNEDLIAAHKRGFLDFLDNDVSSVLLFLCIHPSSHSSDFVFRCRYFQIGKGVYMRAIRDLAPNKRHRLIVGIDHVRDYSLDLARR